MSKSFSCSYLILCFLRPPSVPLALLRSRGQEGIRPVRGFLGEGAGEGGRHFRLQAGLTSVECEKVYWEGGVLDCCVTARGFTQANESSNSITYWRIPTSCQVGPACVSCHAQPLSESSLWEVWPRCENSPEKQHLGGRALANYSPNGSKFEQHIFIAALGVCTTKQTFWHSSGGWLMDQGTELEETAAVWV